MIRRADKTVLQGDGCRLYRTLRRCLATADLGGRRNVAPLYDMCYYSFLIKKAAVKEVLDFTDFIESRIESVFPD